MIVSWSRRNGVREVTGGGGSRPTLGVVFNAIRLWARRSRWACGALRPREKRRLVETVLSRRGLRGIHRAGWPGHGIRILQQAKVNGGLRIESRRRGRGK